MKLRMQSPNAVWGWAYSSVCIECRIKGWDLAFLDVMLVLQEPQQNVGKCLLCESNERLRETAGHLESGVWRKRRHPGTSPLGPSWAMCWGSTEGGTRGKRHKQNVEISEVLLLGKKQEEGVKSLILNEEGRITTPPRPCTRKAFVDTSYVHLCSFEWSNCMQKPENLMRLIFRSRATPW